MCIELPLYNRYDCVVVANGEFPRADCWMAAIRSASLVVACDGALESLRAAGILPHAVVGDLDSAGDIAAEDYSGVVVHNPDQETNDLTKAIVYVRSQSVSHVLILGATGLREDHTLGNISLLANYVGWFTEIRMASDYGCFTAIDRTTEFASFVGQQVSIFSLDPDSTDITTDGLAYGVSARRFRHWWEGTLNESIADRFTVTLNDSVGWVLVYQVLDRREV